MFSHLAEPSNASDDPEFLRSGQHGRPQPFLFSFISVSASVSLWFLVDVYGNEGWVSWLKVQMFWWCVYTRLMLFPTPIRSWTISIADYISVHWWCINWVKKKKKNRKNSLKHTMLWKSSPFPKCAVEPNLIPRQMWSICISLMFVRYIPCPALFYFPPSAYGLLPLNCCSSSTLQFALDFRKHLALFSIQNVLQCVVCVLAVSITENGHDGGRQEELLLGGDPGDRIEVLQDTGGHWKGDFLSHI